MSVQSHPMTQVAGVTPVRVARARDLALDYTKGVLVLFMVLYHWLNYFVVLDWDVYRYLRFLTPSFIFITGFLISNIYLSKYSGDDPRLHARLARRGLKLLLLFVALNLLAGLVSRGAGSLVNDWYGVFVTGNGHAAFNVLLGIAYFLLLTPVMLIASRVSRLAL